MANAHRQAVNAAVRTGRDIGRLFARIGTANHPRGLVLSAYRNARRALRDVYRRRPVGWRGEVRESLHSLRQDVRQATGALLTDAETAGRKAGTAQAQARDIRTTPIQVSLDPLQDAWLGPLEIQITTAEAVAFEEALVLGDATHAGLLHPGPMSREGSRWVALAVTLGFLGELGLSPEEGVALNGWQKQAVAALDERTTECCLKVHAQIVPMDGTFLTLGEPAWADHQEWPAFHWF